jgi:hypothetical protein
MHFIGIDPGASGAICVLDSSNRHPLFIDFSKDLLAYEIMNLIRWEIGNRPKVHVCLEEVHSLHGMSAKSNFAFGGAFWRARTLMEAMMLPFELVQPKAWQQAVGVPAKKDRNPEEKLKVIVARRAAELYPHASLWGPRGGLKDGRADALMIAHYGLITHGEDYGLQADEIRAETPVSKDS